ncbi:hypothetical protein [Geoalkalibacter subterraneus]|uniref:DUF4384 domain-containing protein n=1 Tax=Geoalkalibacter subterraneus TaxID=483547 RepID=A0A0B5FPM0_9BACT|nr:hypothetical protein [Geoalkalibacter subterraneus]AJF06010.1 hypothetical protein GSUB_04780 [Geoalkalibacter subterraneus]
MRVGKRVVSIFVLLGLVCLVAPASSVQALTQRDWMVALVDALGWSFGLPDEPQESDYQEILSGERVFRVEAEEAHQPEDLVAVKTFENFGPFSGEGWLAGIATETRAHLQFLLPRDGSYHITASLRLPGHRIRIGGREVEASAGNRFETVPLGTFSLEAGPQEIVVDLPPSAAIDYLELRAAPLPKIEPLNGWRPQAPLSRSDLAVTAVRLLAAENCLPPMPQKISIEAETSSSPGGAQIETSRYLGVPSEGAWLRAGTTPARVRLHFRVERDGVYRVALTGVGSESATLSFNGGRSRSQPLNSFLAEKEVGTVYLERGSHYADIELPAGNGVDKLVLHALHSDPSDYARLAGMSAMDGKPDASEIDLLLSLLASVGASR